MADTQDDEIDLLGLLDVLLDALWLIAGMTVLAYAGRNAPGPLIAAGATRTFTDMRELPELLA